MMLGPWGIQAYVHKNCRGRCQLGAPIGAPLRFRGKLYIIHFFIYFLLFWLDQINDASAASDAWHLANFHPDHDHRNHKEPLLR